MASSHARNPSSAPDGSHPADHLGGDEVVRLILELRARGIRFLTGGHDAELEAKVAAHPLPPEELLRRLADCHEPSVRDATIALLLRHPDLAAYLPAEADAPNGPGQESLFVLALAAIYLQRMWRTRLALALGELPLLPARYWAAAGLPDPDGSLDGLRAEMGLRTLAVGEWQRTGRPFNYLSMWQQQVDHLAAQAWRERRRRTIQAPRYPARELAAPPPKRFQGALGMPHAPRGGTPMSMRAPADRQRIEHFLERLGQQARLPGRLYLVGGTTMVYEGFRATTMDIDVLVEADDSGPLMGAIRSLKDELDLNIEFASPRDFIPLPAGWRERSVYIGRYGPLEVFHFDLYSMALSKIERGTERDFQDVLALLRAGRLNMEQLASMFAEILPRVATEGLGGMDPDVFAEHFHYLREQFGADETA